MSAMAVTVCVAGENVWVANIHEKMGLLYSTEFGETHFTGFKL